MSNAPLTEEGALVWAGAQRPGAWAGGGFGPVRLDRAYLARAVGEAVTAEDLDVLADALESGVGEALRAKRAEQEERP